VSTSQEASRVQHAAPVGAWGLPSDAFCAKQARALVDDLLTGLGASRDTVRDAKLMVSELATNAYQHAAGFIPHELWLDVSDTEAIIAIFDAMPLDENIGDVTFSGDHGRGLLIVADLSGGRWGLEQPAPSRLHEGVQGKAVWFGCPLRL
jgi:hypothetical protein